MPRRARPGGSAAAELREVRDRDGLAADPQREVGGREAGRRDGPCVRHEGFEVDEGDLLRGGDALLRGGFAGPGRGGGGVVSGLPVSRRRTRRREGRRSRRGPRARAPCPRAPGEKRQGSRSSAIQQILWASRPARSASHPADEVIRRRTSRRPSGHSRRRGATKAPDLDRNEEVGEIPSGVGGAIRALVARRLLVAEHDDDRAPPRHRRADERGRRHGRREPIPFPREKTLVHAGKREGALAVVVLRGAVVALQAVHPVRDTGRATEGAAGRDGGEEDDVVHAVEQLPHAPRVPAERFSALPR